MDGARVLLESLLGKLEIKGNPSLASLKMMAPLLAPMEPRFTADEHPHCGPARPPLRDNYNYCVM